MLRVLSAHRRGGVPPASEAQWRVLLRWAAADAARSEARWRRGAPSEELADSALAPPAARPERALERREFATGLVLALQALPTRQREVFVLRALYEWPFERIAARLQITPSTARQHAFGARSLLRAALRAYDSG